MDEREPLYEKHLRAGGRRYQIEVHLADNGHRYLRVEEIRPSRNPEDNRLAERILVFDDHIARFMDVIQEAATHMPPAEDDQDTPTDALYTRDELLAGAEPDSDDVSALYYSGKTVAQIATTTGRSEAAIESELKAAGAI